MKKMYTILSLSCFLSTFVGYAIADENPPNPENYFDFWLGEWDLHWYHEDGSISKGYNRIVRILDGKVIQENFESYSEKEEVPLKGMSLSVYNPRTKSWHQAWADNQGSYFNFQGNMEGKHPVFFTERKKEDGSSVLLRMVFSEIQQDSLLWTWEASEDDGKSWNEMWKIYYQRRKGSK